VTHVLSCLHTGENQNYSTPVALFSVMRNERALLPRFLAHYRNLGIESFFIVDNHSTDGTTEFLRAQPDVTLYWTGDRFSESNCGTDWANALIGLHGQDRWCLFVDGDELLTFRDSEERPVHDFLDEVEQRGARAVFGYMLDFYPDGPLSRAVLTDDADFFQVCNSHDRDYVFRVTPTKPWRTMGFPAFEVLGGPRLRLWSSLEKEANTTWLDYFVRGQIDRIERWVPKSARPQLSRLFEKQPPHLQKVPIVKPVSGSGFRYYMNAHSCSRLPLHHENAVLCHFKFTASFVEKAKREVERGEHYRGGSQYQRYLQLLTQGESSSVCYEGTVSYGGTRALCDLGLIRSLTELDHRLLASQQAR
jgi:glycosyltransferase involved in cell wall biosynthesis